MISVHGTKLINLNSYMIMYQDSKKILFNLLFIIYYNLLLLCF